jgi:hypothetical protein
MKKSIVLAAVTATALLSCQAWSQESGGFKLKHRSSFTLQDAERNPFWPVGWVKTVATATSTNENVQAAELRPEDFEVTAVLLGTPALAVVNGREYAEGDFITLRGSGQKTKVQIAQVMDGQVVLRYMGKDYPIILHRKGEEIGIKKVQPSPME